ncbi:hypothetical protein H4582DRAFT_2103082 [Lactarius indigo]|nr:hypothetical protein H4582DRAFT_2103082 [Lactarius indigo]
MGDHAITRSDESTFLGALCGVFSPRRAATCASPLAKPTLQAILDTRLIAAALSDPDHFLDPLLKVDAVLTVRAHSPFVLLHIFPSDGLLAAGVQCPHQSMLPNKKQFTPACLMTTLRRSIWSAEVSDVDQAALKRLAALAGVLDIIAFTWRCNGTVEVLVAKQLETHMAGYTSVPNVHKDLLFLSSTAATFSHPYTTYMITCIHQPAR